MPRDEVGRLRLVDHQLVERSDFLRQPQRARAAAGAGGLVRIDTVTNGMLWFEGAVKQDPAIDRWLNEQAPALSAIATTWFFQMRECGDDVRELMHDGCPVACVGDAPFGNVNVFIAHVNVGFFLGAELDDPTGLLEGNGRRMRHVKVKPGVDFNVAALRALVHAAYGDIKSRLMAD